VNLAKYLHHLIQKIWNTEEIHENVKEAFIATIFKRGYRQG